MEFVGKMLGKMLDDLGIILWSVPLSFTVILGNLTFNISNFFQVERITFSY